MVRERGPGWGIINRPPIITGSNGFGTHPGDIQAHGFQTLDNNISILPPDLKMGESDVGWDTRPKPTGRHSATDLSVSNRSSSGRKNTGMPLASAVNCMV
jgi:hypothetical protein